MNLITELLDSLTRDGPVSEVLVGARWTLVGGQAGWGMAGTRAEETGGHASNVIAQAGQLTDCSARQLAEMAGSAVPLERSVGLAALNSLVDVDPSQTVDLNVSDYLVEHGQGRNMVVVGSFPFLERLRAIPKRFWVLELSPGPDELPASAADQIIPQADVVAITGTALINHTLEGLLALANKVDPASGQISDLMAGSVNLNPQGLRVDGDATFAVFTGAQVYNAESVEDGDVIFGSNNADEANIYWDKSSGELQFRGGTTKHGWITSSGKAVFGGGDIVLDAQGILMDETFAVFATTATYQGESVSSGDMVIGNSSANKANIYWDKSSGVLQFRGGTTVQGWIEKD